MNVADLSIYLFVEVCQIGKFKNGKTTMEKKILLSKSFFNISSTELLEVLRQLY